MAVATAVCFVTPMEQCLIRREGDYVRVPIAKSSYKHPEYVELYLRVHTRDRGAFSYSLFSRASFTSTFRSFRYTLSIVSIHTFDIDTVAR